MPTKSFNFLQGHDTARIFYEPTFRIGTTITGAGFLVNSFFQRDHLSLTLRHASRKRPDDRIATVAANPGVFWV